MLLSRDSCLQKVKPIQLYPLIFTHLKDHLVDWAVLAIKILTLKLLRTLSYFASPKNYLTILIVILDNMIVTLQIHWSFWSIQVFHHHSFFIIERYLKLGHLSQEIQLTILTLISVVYMRILNVHILRLVLLKDSESWLSSIRPTTAASLRHIASLHYWLMLAYDPAVSHSLRIFLLINEDSVNRGLILASSWVWHLFWRLWVNFNVVHDKRYHRSFDNESRVLENKSMIFHASLVLIVIHHRNQILTFCHHRLLRLLKRLVLSFCLDLNLALNLCYSLLVWQVFLLL